MLAAFGRFLSQRGWPTLSLPFLAFGPLDAWYRLLFRPRATIPLRYVPRVAAGLGVSLLISVLTLPERLVVRLWLGARGPGRIPGPVIILGYYRSGTTHLQFLLSRDPLLYSPRWNQALSPQGFLLSWSLLKWFLLPFFPNKRPQDNLAFGADIPAEDDFVLANEALASPLIGRHVLHELREHYERFHDLKTLAPEELARWRGCQLGFVRKLGLLAGRRRILLKTPAHTARVDELLSLFQDCGGVRFIHISRKPDAVLRSNMGLHRVLNDLYSLQEPPSEEEIEQRILREYLTTEQSYLASRDHIPPGHLSEVRLEDLLADPVGEVQRLYTELGLPYTEAFEQRLLEYLDATKSYEPNRHPTRQTEHQGSAVLQPLVQAFHHEKAPREAKAAPLPRALQPDRRRGRLWQASVLAAVVALGSLVPWLGLTWLTGLRLDGLSWLAGMAIGSATIHTARRGTAWLGMWAVGLTLGAQVVASLGTTWLLTPEAESLPVATAAMVPWLPVLCWLLLGCLGAYRLSTRQWI